MKRRAAKRSVEPACIICGCTEHNACVDAFGDGCAWVVKTRGAAVCSSCYPRLVSAAPAMFLIMGEAIAEDTRLADGNEAASRKLWRRVRAVFVKAGGPET